MGLCLEVGWHLGVGYVHEVPSTTSGCCVSGCPGRTFGSSASVSGGKMLKGRVGKYGRPSALAAVSIGSSVGCWVGVAFGETVSRSSAAAGKLLEGCPEVLSLVEV